MKNNHILIPAETETSMTEGGEYPLRRLRVIFWIMAVVLGFVHVWADRHLLQLSDGMPYLDVADAYLRADWHTAINSYWSPLYSWLIALAFLIVKPSPYWKFAVLHLTNLVIYLLSLGCLEFLIYELVVSHRNQRAELSKAKLVTLPDWAWLALGYALFIWSSLYLIGVSLETPDMTVAALVFLASGTLLRIRRRREGWVPFVLLGIALGLGYLAKTVMFPLAFIFLAAGMFSVGNLRRALPRVLVSAAIFLLIAIPFIFAISRAKGRLTFGDSGRLNYVWIVDADSGNGGSKHPKRKIFDAPPIYEFGHPVGGTYPPQYDPPYWHEGSVGHFNLRGQLKALEGNAEAFFELFHMRGVQYGLFVGFLSLYLMSRRGWRLLYDLAPCWCLILPALAGLGIYSPLFVQGRYVAPFLVLLWLGLFSGVRLPFDRESQRLITCVMIVLIAMMVVTVTASSGREARLTAHDLLVGEDTSANETWQVAEGLHQMGFAPGDKVAYIGTSIGAYWAHLAGIRIVADIATPDADSFWAADASVKNRAIEALQRTGAKAIVAVTPPACADLNGWRRIGNTGYYAYLLSP